MPRRRRRIIKGMGTPRGMTQGKKRGIAKGKAEPPPLYPGWAPGDRWGPGEHDVIPGGPPTGTQQGGGRPRTRPKPAEGGGREFNPPTRTRPKPAEGGGREFNPPTRTRPKGGGGFRGRPPGFGGGGVGRYLGPPTPTGKRRKKPAAGGIEVYGTGERITPYKVGEKRVHSAGTSKRKRKAPSTGSY